MTDCKSSWHARSQPHDLGRCFNSSLPTPCGCRLARIACRTVHIRHKKHCTKKHGDECPSGSSVGYRIIVTKVRALLTYLLEVKQPSKVLIAQGAETFESDIWGARLFSWGASKIEIMQSASSTEAMHSPAMSLVRRLPRALFCLACSTWRPLEDTEGPG
jgi:hypothetical protein